MVENNQVSQNVYKPRNSLGYAKLIGLILVIPFFIETFIEFLIGDRQLPIIIPQEIVATCENSILLSAVLGSLILVSCWIFQYVHERNNVPLKDEVINDLHDLLENQNFIDGKSPSWESQVELQVKRVNKNIFDVRFRIKDPRGTAEYFRKLNLSEGGTFKNCIDCRVDKDGSLIKLELMFGGVCYD